MGPELIMLTKILKLLLKKLALKKDYQIINKNDAIINSKSIAGPAILDILLT